jgi:hypothetical protein
MSHVDATAVLLIIMGATSAAPNLFTLESHKPSGRAKGYQGEGGISQSGLACELSGHFHAQAISQSSISGSG